MTGLWLYFHPQYRHRMHNPAKVCMQAQHGRTSSAPSRHTKPSSSAGAAGSAARRNSAVAASTRASSAATPASRAATALPAPGPALSLVYEP